MKKSIFCLLVLVIFAVAPADGENGHDHACDGSHEHADGHGHDHAADLSQGRVIEKASGYVAKLVDKGNLDASWQGVSPAEVKENDAHEWVVTFFNPDIEDPEKQTLYMFLTMSGKYIAANFTGK